MAGLVICTGLFATGSVPAAKAQSGVQITINNFAFTPNKVTVVIGVNNTVTWTMEQSGVPYHTVTPDPGDPSESWGSGELTTGKSYTFTFTVAGTYGYHCSLHTFMTGTIIVVGASSATSTTSSAVSTSATGQTQNSVPEFPLVTAGLVGFVVLLLATYLVVRQKQMSSKPGNGPA